MAPSQTGPHGALLPTGVWTATNGDLGEGTPGLAGLYGLRAVAFRIDPCFRVGGDGPCQPQIRLVWQPKSGSDAAVHTIHVLAESELGHLVSDVFELRATRACLTSITNQIGAGATKDLRPAVSPRTVYETRAVLARLGY
jgi:hypothetical protein